MRIISGKFRGAKLLSLKGQATRPTSDNVKESVFNVIQSHFPCGAVLDLFAGSGALGLESLSRGADYAVFVENSSAAMDIISKNAAYVKLEPSKFSVVRSDYLTYIKSANNKFDIIFLDPPYNQGCLSKAVEAIHKHEILADNGILVIESEVGGEDVEFLGFEAITTKKYGRIQISILQIASK
ncbi:MAG: 16S rRNA (guanine(966)-N(2))-methyltransferase RsmD [Oscillospiraceae bacterium]|nr:16S rRNA (guanine(966)-N(2))-methyltransferase RsmD [Oscillospiraceae bacterium]